MPLPRGPCPKGSQPPTPPSTSACLLPPMARRVAAFSPWPRAAAPFSPQPRPAGPARSPHGCRDRALRAPSQWTPRASLRATEATTGRGRRWPQGSNCDSSGSAGHTSRRPRRPRRRWRAEGVAAASAAAAAASRAAARAAAAPVSAAAAAARAPAARRLRPSPRQAKPRDGSASAPLSAQPDRGGPLPWVLLSCGCPSHC